MKFNKKDIINILNNQSSETVSLGELVDLILETSQSVRIGRLNFNNEPIVTFETVNEKVPYDIKYIDLVKEKLAVYANRSVSESRKLTYLNQEAICKTWLNISKDNLKQDECTKYMSALDFYNAFKGEFVNRNMTVNTNGLKQTINVTQQLASRIVSIADILACYDNTFLAKIPDKLIPIYSLMKLMYNTLIPDYKAVLALARCNETDLSSCSIKHLFASDVCMDLVLEASDLEQYIVDYEFSDYVRNVWHIFRTFQLSSESVRDYLIIMEEKESKQHG